jgi:hypothetical protein
MAKMRFGLLVAALPLAVAAALAGSSSASATPNAPSCSVPPSVVILDPPEVAFGQPYSITLGGVDRVGGVAADAGPIQGTATLSVFSASTDRLLSRTDLPSVGRHAGQNNAEIEGLHAGSSPERIHITYETNPQGATDVSVMCDQRISATESPTSGRAPLVTPALAFGYERDNTLEAGIAVRPPAGGCSQMAATTPVRVTVSRQRASTTFNLTPCGGPAFGARSLSGLRLANDSEDLTQDGAIGLGLFPARVVKRSFTNVYRLTVNYQSRRIFRRKVVLKNEYDPGERIYEDNDFDEYVNVCIDGGYTVYSQNQRLYCFVSQTLEAFVELRR